MKVLLTGAAGFIGSHVAERLCARNDSVVGFDNFDAFYPRAVKERNLAALRAPGAGTFSLVEGDVRQRADLERALAAAGGGVDVVFHLAALGGVRPSLDDPGRFFDVNVDGTVNVLEACRAHGIKRFVFGSSSSVYGEGSVPPFHESDPCARPLSPYAATKRSGEILAFTAHHVAGINTTCLRFFTVYGPRQRPDLAIHKFTQRIATGGVLDLFGDGSTARDYTWIDDIVDGSLRALDQQTRDAQPQYRIYNLGGNETTTLLQLVDHIAVALNRAPIIQRRPPQAGDMPRTLADLSLSARELGYAPKMRLADGIKKFVSWWQSEYGHSLGPRP